MSRVTFVFGRALNSLQFHTLTGFGPILTVNFQSEGSTCGVGPGRQDGENPPRDADLVESGLIDRRLSRGR